MAIAEDQFQRLAPQAYKCMRLSTMIGVLIMIAAAVAAWMILLAEQVALPLPAYFALGLWGVGWIIYGIVSPAIRYRRYRYLVDEEKLVVREGMWFISQGLAPLERIHQVTIKNGPIDRLYGLAKVIVTTAGGTLTIRFLERELAEQIAESLLHKVRYLLKQQGLSIDNMPDREINDD